MNRDKRSLQGYEHNEKWKATKTRQTNGLVFGGQNRVRDERKGGWRRGRRKRK